MKNLNRNKDLAKLLTNNEAQINLINTGKTM
jgi:hypothetical protein